jgi:hypothetical protein
MCGGSPSATRKTYSCLRPPTKPIDLTEFDRSAKVIRGPRLGEEGRREELMKAYGPPLTAGAAPFRDGRRGEIWQYDDGN